MCNCVFFNFGFSIAKSKGARPACKSFPLHILYKMHHSKPQKYIFIKYNDAITYPFPALD